MSAPRAPELLVGIDLGTTNCAVAFAPIGAESAPEVVPLRQLVAAGEVGERSLLPSSIYLPGEHELAPGALRLPWGEPADAVGEMARDQGARVPGRLVASAKSWLSHPGVDRTAAMLPIGAPMDLVRISPVDATTRLLRHLVDAFGDRFPDAPLTSQRVVVTVPASFDAMARTLTVEAARHVGFDDAHLTLLEEPQAAFYDVLRADRAADAGRVLIVDVGGGTTDLTLIQAGRTLERLAVGDHILLGGDNMDMTLARLAESRLGRRLEPARWGLLCQSCRMAKEALLQEGDRAPESFRVAVPGRGSKLLGGALTVDIGRDEAVALLVDGFFPRGGLDARPARALRGGLTQLGLPYATDAGITRHIAEFLARHGARVDAVLLNGGVFRSPLLAERVCEVVSAWQDGPVRVLEPISLDLAVARGAVAFAQARQGQGRRIEGGSARSYFVEVSGGRGVCLLPMHHPTGEVAAIQDRTFDLVVGTPVRFMLHETTGEHAERPGDVVPLDSDNFVPLPPIETALQGAGGRPKVRVTLQARLTEVGVLEVAAAETEGERRWGLELALRGGRSTGAGAITAAGALAADARRQVEELVHLYYGRQKRDGIDTRDVRRLIRDMEGALNKKRERWTLPELRELWELLRPSIKRRRRSEDHEASYLYLAGYVLRPGFGYSMDDWRVRDLFGIFQGGIEHHRVTRIWQTWWVLWRRVAGGLDARAQTTILHTLTPWLRPAPGAPKLAGPVPQGEDEAIRLLACLEGIDPGAKAVWGDWLLDRVQRDVQPAQSAWALGRLGARVPVAGAVHCVVDPEVADAWLGRLLTLDWSVQNVPFAAAHIARATGDRLRDIDDDLRERVALRLERAKAPVQLARMVREPTHLDAEDQGRLMGEALPEGLHLVE